MPLIYLHILSICGIMHNNDDDSMFEEERQESISCAEDFYCDRLTELVDEKRIEDASSIFEEFVVDNKDPDDWFFMKKLDEEFIEENWN